MRGKGEVRTRGLVAMVSHVTDGLNTSARVCPHSKVLWVMGSDSGFNVQRLLHPYSEAM